MWLLCVYLFGLLLESSLLFDFWLISRFWVCEEILVGLSCQCEFVVDHIVMQDDYIY